MKETIEQALIPYTGKFKEDPAVIQENLLTFLALRLEHLLEGESGIEQETVQAVIAAGWDDFVEVKQKALTLQAFKSHPDFLSLAIGCKRALNILKGVSSSETGKVQAELLIEAEEKKLFEEVVKKQVELEGLFQQKGYSEYLVHLAHLHPTIDAFFNKVLVMSPDEKIRKNRLALLFQLTAFFNRFAIFSKFNVQL